MQFSNLHDFEAFINATYKKKYNPTEQMIKNGFPMPKFLKFINRTNPPKNWKRLESFMYIDGKKIKESYPENKKLIDSSAMYINGIIIEKKKDKIIFLTYTLYDGKCVLNHTSYHTLNGNLKRGKTNMFHYIKKYSDYGEGGSYVNTMLDELNKKIDNKKFEWDIVSTA